ncbi:MAG: hypothetical protein Q9167_005064 [Letrouitia subvulpina]
MASDHHASSNALSAYAQDGHTYPPLTWRKYFQDRLKYKYPVPGQYFEWFDANTDEIFDQTRIWDESQGVLRSSLSATLLKRKHKSWTPPFSLMYPTVSAKSTHKGKSILESINRRKGLKIQAYPSQDSGYDEAFDCLEGVKDGSCERVGIDGFNRKDELEIHLKLNHGRNVSTNFQDIAPSSSDHNRESNFAAAEQIPLDHDPQRSEISPPDHHRKVEHAAIEQGRPEERSRRSRVLAVLGREESSRIANKIILYGKWLKEHHAEPPQAIWQNNFNIIYSHHDDLSNLDTAMSYLERFSGQSWDWWPLTAPERTIEPGRERIQWQCGCGDLLYVDASSSLARRCTDIRTLLGKQRDINREASFATNEETSEKDTSEEKLWRPPKEEQWRPTKEEPTEGETDTISGKGSSSQTGAGGSLTHTKGGAGNKNSSPTFAGNEGGFGPANDSENNFPGSSGRLTVQADLFILFGIIQNSKVDHTQIEIRSPNSNDAHFFNDLRCQYRHLRGFLRHWLSPFIFSHCCFVKYTRFFVNELAYVGSDLPVDPNYVYSPRPPGPHEDPPISAHEFNRRFYLSLCNPCGRTEAVERIPKRVKRFQTSLHINGREDMWGLQVELRPSFFRILLWQIAITAGGWMLMVWWLVNHKNDLQGASVPVTLILTAMVALWVPLWEKMK